MVAAVGATTDPEVLMGSTAAIIAPSTLFTAADTAIAAHDAPASMAVLRLLTARWPLHPGGWARLARALLMCDDPHRALLAAHRGLGIDPTHAACMSAASMAAFALGDPYAASRTAHHAIPLDFHAPEVHNICIAASVALDQPIAAIVAAATMVTCRTCSAMYMSGYARRRAAVQTLVHAMHTLPADTPHAVVAFLDAARAIVHDRHIPALAACNRIRTDPDRTPPLDEAARLLTSDILRVRRLRIR
jgi:hypothetical protein